MVGAHCLALATERSLRVHVEPVSRRPRRLVASGTVQRLPEILTALRREISVLSSSGWGPAGAVPMRDIQTHISSLQAQVGIETEGAIPPSDGRGSEILTASLRSLLADSDSLIAIAAREADADAQRLKSNSRRAFDLQLAAAAASRSSSSPLSVGRARTSPPRARNPSTGAKASDLNAELDAFCGRGQVAHDQLSPPTPILGNAQLLARGVDPARSRELGTRIARTTTRLEKLIEGLLSLARTQSGAVGTGRADAAEVLAVLLNEMAERIEHLGAEVHISVEPTLVRCPPSLLSTVLQNQLDNALRYGRRQGEPARLSIEVRPADGWGRMRVSDEGPGIGDDARAQVFSPYFQENPGRGGLGLGLATARRVVESFGGSITLSSEVNVGTTFEVLLPLFSKASSPAASKSPADFQTAVDRSKSLALEPGHRSRAFSPRPWPPISSRHRTSRDGSVSSRPGVLSATGSSLP